MAQRAGVGRTAWGARLSFAGVLLVFSELVVWQRPGAYSATEWAGVALVYVALAAALLDLLARFDVNDALSLMLAAGIYGLLDATLISHVTTRDLPLSLLVRPLGAQPLAFVAALGAFRLLGRGRAPRRWELLAALGIGLAWGVWVRWLPVASQDATPAASARDALAALFVALIALLAWRYLTPWGVERREDWRLRPVEWGAVAGVLVGALALALARDALPTAGLPVVAGLVAFLGSVLYATQTLRAPRSYLAEVTPPGMPLPAAWLAVIALFLLAGWVGLNLPGSGESSLVSDLLFGGLAAFGGLWPPVVSALIGVRAVIQLTRQGM